jgi:thioredoxin reductase (NADPH)
VKETGLLTGFADLVYLIAPSKKLKVAEDHPVLKAEKVRVLTGHSVTAIEGNEVVEKLRMFDSDRNEKVLELSGVFIYLHGSKPIIDFLGNTVELSEIECVVTNRMMETSIPGVFGAGDVTCTEVRQVVLAAANGCVAALSAEQHIHHKRRHRYDWG